MDTEEEKKCGENLGIIENSSLVDEGTTIEVPNPPVTEDEVDGDIEPPAKRMKDDPKVKEAFEKARARCVERYNERKAEDKFDPETLVFEDENKTIPLVTMEDIKLFDAASEGMFEGLDMETYVSMARSDIEDYNSLKAQYDAGELDETDLEYFENATRSKDESFILLATIQQNAKELARDFKESHIAEDTIRTVINGMLIRSIVNRFKLTRSWDPLQSGKKLEELDDTKLIVEAVQKNMYPATFYKEYAKFDSIRAKNLRHNQFFIGKFNDSIDDIIWALSTYVKNNPSAKIDSITIGKILEKDFKVLDFTRTITSYATVKTNSDLVSTTEEGSKINENVLKLGETIAPNESFDELTNTVEATLDSLIANVITNTKKIETLRDLALDNFKRDPMYKKLIADNPDVNLEEFNNTCIKISDLIPDLTNSTIPKWGKSYAFIQKYVRYFTYFDYLRSYELAGSDERAQKINAFVKFVVPLLTDWNVFTYSNIVNTLYSNVADEYPKDSRSMVFSTIVNNMLLQHELGFKSKLEPGTTELKGEMLFEVAKSVFGERYEFMVDGSDIEKDILLGKVDIIEVKKAYFQNTIDIINMINMNFAEFIDTPEETWKAQHESYYMPNKSPVSGKKKKPRSKRRR